MNPLFFYLVYFATLLAPAIYAFVIRRRVMSQHRPILVFIWVILAVEIFSTFFAHEGVSRAIADNTPYLIEFLLVLWVAKTWKTFERFPSLIPILAIAALGVWATEKFIDGWQMQLSWVRVSFSALITLLAIVFIGQRLAGPTGRNWKNPVLLFSIGLGLYHSLFSIFEVILFAADRSSETLVSQMFYFSLSLGILINLIYLNALLCLPTRIRFSFH